MKKILILILTLCLIPFTIAAEEEERTPAVFVFGDGWAAQWCGELKGFYEEDVEIINCAAEGALLSEISKNAYYNKVEKGDVVIISYGVMARDYRSDSIPLFKPSLEKTVGELRKKGADVMLVSVCSTQSYNMATGKPDETKNYFTETQKAFAADNHIAYVNLAESTADMLEKLGNNDAFRLYSAPMTLAKNGRKLCAIEVSNALHKEKLLTRYEKCGMSVCYKPQINETRVVFDMFVESMYCDDFKVYIKNGTDASVNYAPLKNGDSEITAGKTDEIIVNFKSADMIQIAPVYYFEAGDTDKPFEIELRNGLYDFSVEKTEPLKASVYADGYLIASNLDMPGTEPVPHCAVHTFRKYNSQRGKVEFTVKGLTEKLKSVSVAESECIFDKKPRIFIGGDSTVCNYYPLVRTGDEADGTVMTGWGQLLGGYTDSEVINLAASGDWAANWRENSFPIIEKEGQPGDILILQFGINDHDKSTVEEMKAALSDMTDRAVAKGMTPVLVSPQISAGYGWGNTSEVGKSDGGAYEEFFSAVRKLAGDKGCFYVDLTDASAGWFSEIGRDAVYRKYHIWDFENNCPKDMMHLSYKGARAMCSFFVTSLKEIKNEGQTDFWGHELSMLTLW